MADEVRRLLWASLADQRPGRELTWLSLMPGTRVTSLGDVRPEGDIDWIPGSFRRPVRRFVEAGALAWQTALDDVPPEFDWVASLEMCSLVTGQVSRYARRHGLRQAVVLWENDAHQPLYRIPPYRGALRRARDADFFLCFVESARDHLMELGLPPERAVVVHPGVDTDLFRPGPEPVAAPVAAFVSPLIANKGIDRVLDAFRLVRRRIPEAELVVLGDGPLAPLVRAEASDPSRGVRYLGARPAAEVADVLRGAAVFVTAPRPTWKWNEQFGLAYIEAQACGLPVVTTRCGTNHEAVRGGNVLVDDRAEDLADALVTFLSDAGLRRVVGRDNRQRMLAGHEVHTQARHMGEAFSAFEPRGARGPRSSAASVAPGATAVPAAARRRPLGTIASRPDVSVVVTTRNVERTLRACLVSVLAQDHPSFELLVVDNHSTDATQDIAAELADRVLVAGPERSAQRNLGVRESRGDWVLWIDADMVLAPDVLSSARRLADEGGAVAVAVPEVTVGAGFWTACRTLERSCYQDDPDLSNPRLVRRDYLEALGGFDETMAGPEDTDLRLRLHADGAVLAQTQAFIEHDEGRLTLADIVRKRVYYGRSLPSFSAANPGAVPAQARGTVSAFVRHRRDLARDPLHAAGMLVMRTVEAGAYAVGAWQGRRAAR